MQIGPLFLTLVICAWLYLSALAWALSAAIRRAEPRFSALGIGLVLSALTVAATITAGRQSVPGLVLSFPACFAASLSRDCSCNGYHEFICPPGMSRMSFRLEKRYVDEMITHAREEEPNECCGILLGHDGEVTGLRRCRNAENSPFRYSVDPHDLFEAYREAENNGWEFVSIYHSHTHTEAYPSPTDVRLAAYPDAIYILVSLQNPEQPVVRAYQIRDGVITEEPLETIAGGQTQGV